MAEITKKLHFLKNGTEQTAKAYSTTAEAGSSYITNVIDGVTCYIPLVGTSDSRATVGRVLKGGTTYAIATQAKPAYTEQSWTTAGTYTWTAPAGVTRVRVAVCGGGSGGSLTAKWQNSWLYSGAGGNSKFGDLIQATGGGPSAVICKDLGDDGDYKDAKAGTGGSPNGRSGKTSLFYGSTSISGGTGFALSFNLVDGSYGNGGSCGGDTNRAYASGGSGGYNTDYVTVTSGTTYTIIVGSGGMGVLGPSSSSSKWVNSGNSGFVYIAYGGDI